jgi:NAD(P)-dependent dehydrogenase (short-subunit alcohol dehydrogenase family)
VITGANSGLRYHTAVALAEAKASVIMACRNIEKCEQAKAQLVLEGGSKKALIQMQRAGDQVKHLALS